MIKQACGLAVLLLGTWASSSAYADLHLTPSQCQRYPFTKPASGEVTQRGLQRELGELEAVGYRPNAVDAYYPDDIEKAEKKLQTVYKRDCSGMTSQ
ncbi:exported protein of unknown function [Pararobbsia alpina]|uniref:hypothetical protein n=1 Tax=Pararobbsia alpina TaxID=621374 RepID=UPI0039A5D16F